MLRVVSTPSRGSAILYYYFSLFTPVDSQLAKQSSLTAVSEILNGCMLEPFFFMNHLMRSPSHSEEQVLRARRSNEDRIARDPR